MQPDPPRTRRAPHGPSPSRWSLALAGLFSAAALLSWQAFAVPGVVALLRPALGGAAPVLVQVLSVLAGGLALHAVLRAAAARAAAAATGGDHATSADDERHLRDLMEALPVGMLVVCGDRVVSANAAARMPLRLAPDCPGPLAAGLFDDPALARDALSGALPAATLLQLRRSDGTTLRAQLSVHAITLGQRGFRVLVFEDLSARDGLDVRLRQQSVELHALAGRLLTVQEDERRSLSRELHDDIGQAITAIKLGAVSLLDRDDDGDGGRAGAQARAWHAEIVNEIVATADQTVVKLRNLSMLLRPPQLDALGLEAALRWQSQALFRSHRTVLALELAPLPQRPDAAVELACFRIAQEALTNVVRHSDAGNVTVALITDGGTLVLSVHDDGRGFDPQRSSGLGLVTMRERAQQLGGSFRIDTEAGVGTRLHARLPMAVASAAP